MMESEIVFRPHFMHLKIHLLSNMCLLCLICFKAPAQVATPPQKSRLDMRPEQSPANPPLKEIISEDIYNFGPSTNLVSLLESIRDLSKKEQFDKAQNSFFAREN